MHSVRFRRIGRYLFVAGILLLQSCSYVTVMRTKEMKAISAEVQASASKEAALTNARVDSLRQELDSLKAENARLMRRLIADLATLNSRVTDDADHMNARLEEAIFRLDYLMEGSKKVTKKVVVNKGKTDQAGSSTDYQAMFVVEERNPELDKLYTTARADFHRSEYVLAYDGFKQIYQKAGQGTMAENALYWMGLCVSMSGKPEKAKKIFDRVLAQFPQGRKTCVVLLKLSEMAQAENNAQEQVQLLQRLVAQPQCRETNESFRAIEQLDQLLGPDGQLKQTENKTISDSSTAAP